MEKGNFREWFVSLRIVGNTLPTRPPPVQIRLLPPTNTMRAARNLTSLQPFLFAPSCLPVGKDPSYPALAGQGMSHRVQEEIFRGSRGAKYQGRDRGHDDKIVETWQFVIWNIEFQFTKLYQTS
jgi:hypothetical protein